MTKPAGLNITERRLVPAERIIELAQDGHGPFRANEIAFGRWSRPGGRRDWADSAAGGDMLRWLREHGMASHVRDTEPRSKLRVGRRASGCYGMAWTVTPDGIAALKQAVLDFKARCVEADKLVEVAVTLEGIAKDMEGRPHGVILSCSRTLRRRAANILTRGGADRAGA